MQLRCLLSLPALLAAVSCTAPQHATESVKPGINDSFLSATSADGFVERFETESREIAAHRDDIVAAVGLREGQAVADVGAGTGLFMEPFAQAVGPSGRVYAVDLAPAMVRHLLQRKRRLGIEQVQVVECTEDSVELPANSVDVVFVCDTYHHFEYPRATLASIHAALRPGGELVVVDFHRIEGVSRPWLLEHVRAGEEVFTAEIEDAGFERVQRRDDLLEENYFLRFRKPGT